MRVLIVADKPDWSYMQIAKALVQRAPHGVEAQAMALKGNVYDFLETEESFDRVLVMGHQMLDLIPHWKTACDPQRWLTGIHSHHSFDPNLCTTTERDVPPPYGLVKDLHRFRRVNAVSQRLTDLFQLYGLPVVYTPNGVDTTVFTPTEPLRLAPPFRAGVAYTPKHDRRKGVQEFIVPACRAAGWELVEAKARSEQHVKPEDMPAWHNTYDVYVCASSSEGLSIAILEAMASGRPVISTKVGGSTECVVHDVNGFLSERTVTDLCQYLMRIAERKWSLYDRGQYARRHAVELWDWNVRAPAWWDFMLG